MEREDSAKMCGIFGIFTKNGGKFTNYELQKMTDDLFVLSESRGKEASGFLLLSGEKIYSYKEPIGAQKFIQQTNYKKIFNKIEAKDKQPLALVGHTRLATNGFQMDNRNNQPIITYKTIGVHNGIIVNQEELWKKFLKKKPRVESDSEVIFELANYYLDKDNSLPDTIRQVFQKIEGSASIAMLFRDTPLSVIATNTGSLYWLSLKNQLIVFASEAYILKKWLRKNKSLFGARIKSQGKQLKAGKGLIINLADLKTKEFSLKKKDNSQFLLPIRKDFILKDYSDFKRNIYDDKTVILYQKLNNLEKLKKHDFDYQAIDQLKRCSKCILPETTPFIVFDKKGVCNYCRSHQKIKHQGLEALKKIIEPYRSKNGEPDCLIGFSGGRDSSYGLHFFKKKLGLNPIAFTYDWGMTTDLAYHNQARILGKLGVEQIVLSADISMKREHIRRHILAWLKKPDLGMVPLFMAGDKQCEFYTNRLAKRNNLKLIFFCRGNELEKEEFKAGYCGIKNADPDGVIHHLPLIDKLKIASYYGRQYLSNPAYIDSSIFDTLLGYFSTYIQRHNYIYLWHYIPWDEEEIVRTLKEEYGWEISKETSQSWRTGDGSSAFYNYIYYQVQGFTENDSFRSNQIREGKLTREKALALVKIENKPRYEALKWYFDRIGLDGDKILSSIDRIKRRY